MTGLRLEDGKNKSVSEILDVTIIGGSIAGLAVAFALTNAGHRVTVFEATDGKNKFERCGAFKLPPNGTLCLNRWGLKTLLDKYSHKFMKYTFYRCEDDALIGTLLLNGLLQHEAFSGQDVADYIFHESSDVWDWLYKLAVDSGVSFRPNSRVVSIDTAKSTITLHNGDEVVSDFIVGADGVNGIARSVVSGQTPDLGGNRFLTVTCTLPCDELLQDKDLATLVDDAYWVVWGGDGVQLQGQVGKRERTYIVTFGYKIPDDVVLDPSLEIFGWYDTFKLGDFKFIDYKKFHGRALKLVNLVKEASQTYSNIHVEQPVLEDLVCDDGRVVLVGDAAHGMIPGQQHNAALGFEDAGVLECLFSSVQSRHNISRLLMAYDEIRGPRIAFGVKIDLSLRDSIMLPKGPLRDQFDDFLRTSAKEHVPAQSDTDDDHLSRLWNDTLKMWLYDASEQVEDWWTKWGNLGTMRELLEHETRRTTIYIDRDISRQ
ncbi:FAD/NAD(P)-binding domain-containing protein [Macrolepiota fuliginosa MF-IS2]|uniref:FAD/NAD(P)-binding domain-containing protein n=1 Tax=Macrolepiota fuliginosa MF-IS2 TaxID=1400762 RepID=A0A9P5XKY7_9AGAR|nr:FAD/NAD(P)-binding domain-containing protein [Macrolepiota fuliginosa MF-IS2]